MADVIVTMLDHAGAEIVKLYHELKPVAQAAQDAAVVAEPFIDVAFPGIAAIFNSTLSLVGLAEATGQAAAAGQSSGPAKLASVVTALTPLVEAYMAQQGVKVDPSVVTEATNLVVAYTKLWPAPAK